MLCKRWENHPTFFRDLIFIGRKSVTFASLESKHATSARIRHASESPENQSGPEVVWNLCGNRSRSGGGSLVFPGRRSCRNRGEKHVGLRYDGERCDLWQWGSLCFPVALPIDVGSGIRAQCGASEFTTGRQHGVLRVCGYGGCALLSRWERVSWVDGFEIPIPPTR